MLMLLRSLLCLVGVLASSAVASAELFYLDHDPLTSKYVGPVGPLVFSGAIEAGDYERLLTKILEDRERFLVDDKLYLASDGGDVGEAIKIAELLQALYTAVTVGPLTGRCVGACFLIFSTAAERTTEGEQLVGVHRPELLDAVAAKLTSGEAASIEDKALRQVRAYLLQSDVPAPLVEQMFARPARDVYWLTAADEISLGRRSPSFMRFLRSNCGWTENLEKEVLSGKRPFKDLAELQACRARATQPAARAALAQLRAPARALPHPRQSVAH